MLEQLDSLSFQELKLIFVEQKEKFDT